MMSHLSTVVTVCLKMCKGWNKFTFVPNIKQKFHQPSKPARSLPKVRILASKQQKNLKAWNLKVVVTIVRCTKN